MRPERFFFKKTFLFMSFPVGLFVAAFVLVGRSNKMAFDGLRLAETAGGRIEDTLPHAAAWLVGKLLQPEDEPKGAAIIAAAPRVSDAFIQDSRRVHLQNASVDKFDARLRVLENKLSN